MLANIAVYVCCCNSFPSGGKSASRLCCFFFSSSVHPYANTCLTIYSLLTLSAFYNSIDSSNLSCYFSRRFGAAAALFRSRRSCYFFFSFCCFAVFAALARTAFVIDLASIYLVFLSFRSWLAFYNRSLTLLRCMRRTSLSSD